MQSTEQQLWRELARTISGQEAGLGEFDGGDVLREAESNGISPLLDRQIKAGTVSGVSDQLGQKLSEAAKAQAVLDMLLNDSTRKTLEYLDEGGVPVLLLKGTPVAHLFYDRTYQRPRCDTDLYIAGDQVEKTAHLLGDHGYQISGLGKRKYSSKQFVASIAPTQTLAINFDVHWKLSNRVMFRSTLPFDECLETSQPVPALGPKARALSSTDLLLHACIHRIAHGRNSEHNRLIWLYDIHLLIQAMTETQIADFASKAVDRKVGSLSADALEVSCDLFNTTIPEHLLKQLSSNAHNEPSAKLLHASKLRWAWEDMQSLEGLKQKYAFARELLANR